MGEHAELLARRKKVLPSWMVLYYEEPIALVDGEGRRVRCRARPARGKTPDAAGYAKLEAAIERAGRS